MSFHDFFSSQSAAYAQFRPNYPQELYKDLVALSPSTNLAWDCACGSGQATVDLSRYFSHVIATDASERQLRSAPEIRGVEYRVAPAEEVSFLEDRSVDLVTVAQAIHWFRFEAFYEEVQRVVKPQGILAAWAYAFLATGENSVDDIMMNLMKVELGPYWAPENQYIWDKYETIPFPFIEVAMPKYELRLKWNLRELMGYFSSWSATQRYIQEKGRHPMEPIYQDLAAAWGDPEMRRDLVSPLVLRVGRV